VLISLLRLEVFSSRWHFIWVHYRFWCHIRWWLRAWSLFEVWVWWFII